MKWRFYAVSGYSCFYILSDLHTIYTFFAFYTQKTAIQSLAAILWILKIDYIVNSLYFLFGSLKATMVIHIHCNTCIRMPHDVLQCLKLQMYFTAFVANIHDNNEVDCTGWMIKQPLFLANRNLQHYIYRIKKNSHIKTGVFQCPQCLRALRLKRL